MMDDSLETSVNAEDGRRHSNASIDMKLEVVVIPISNVDRAKEFYSRLDWRLDADYVGRNGFCLIQFTPPGPGSACPVNLLGFFCEVGLVAIVFVEIALEVVKRYLNTQRK